MNSKSSGRYGSTRNWPMCMIIPSYILESIAFNATGAEAELAKSTLLQTARLQGQRDVLSMTFPMEAAPGVKQRSVYDARNATRLPGLIRLREGGQVPSTELAVAEAYTGAGVTYDLLSTVFQRNSLDGRGMRLNSTTRYGRKFENAFWNGNQMVYGEGDGKLFNRFTIAIDICGHELAHGLTQYTCNLPYEGMSGALNEHISDVFGSLVRQAYLKQDASQADWVIGAGLLTDKVQGTGIRNMLKPGTAYDDRVLGKDPQPASMTDYIVTQEDSGGVHLNSSIPNRAFAVAAIASGGKSAETVGLAWYDTITRALPFGQKATFWDMALATTASAAKLFGIGSKVHEAVKAGWDAVKVDSRSVERRVV